MESLNQGQKGQKRWNAMLAELKAQIKIKILNEYPNTSYSQKLGRKFLLPRSKVIGVVSLEITPQFGLTLF